MESRYLATVKVLNFNLTYNKERLIEDWKNKEKIHISDVNIKYIKEMESKLNKKLKSTKIGDIRKEYANGVSRTDIVSECNTYNSEILNIIKKIKEAIPDAEIGSVAYFFQKKGENVPIHIDFPYRKNSLLLVPLFGIATTYYEDNDEYVIISPVIMNVDIPHGVKNVNEDRLCLHIEIPNLSTNEIKNNYEF